MRELLQINVGGCGHAISTKYWSMIGKEHSIQDDGTYSGSDDVELLNAQICYNQISDTKYTPRSIFVDLDSRSSDEVLGGQLGKLFSLDDFVCGIGGTQGNWAKGFYTDGNDLSDFALDRIRKQCEACDCFQGFQFNMSISGGTGSGLGVKLINRCRDDYPDRIMEVASVFPSVSISNSLVEPYNAMLSIYYLVENTDFVNVIQNQSLYNICSRSCKITAPSFADFNYLIGLQTSDLSSSLRFAGILNTNMRKVLVSIVPFPRLHFFGCSFAPLADIANQTTLDKTTPSHCEYPDADLVKQLFDDKNTLCNLNFKNGTHLCCYTQFRGRLSMYEVENELNNIMINSGQDFKDWIPYSTGISLCDRSRTDFTNSGTLITNHTSIGENYKKLGEQFTNLFRKKAFLHPYINEGMDEMEFTEAESNLNDLSSEYIDWGCWADVEDDEEGEEHETETDQF